MSKEEIIQKFKCELSLNFPNAKDAEVEKAIHLAINNDLIGNLMAMTVYGLLDGKLSNIKDDCEKIFV